MKSKKLIPFIIGIFILSFVREAQLPPNRNGLTEESNSRSDALEALEFWTASRSYPANDISPDKYYRAFLQVKSEIRSANALVQADTLWRFIGPTNFSGRMTCVQLNPQNGNTVYAGAAGGGLWRSYTGGLGADWQRIPTGFPVLGVNAIAIDPADTNVLYIGTGEVYRYLGSIGGTTIRTTRGSYGMGILKSTDGGLTWVKSLDWSYNQQRGVEALQFNPTNSRTIFAATSEGVYRSGDAGQTWQPVLEVLMARNIMINPIDTTLVLATCGNFASPGNGVYRSTDGGFTFEQNTQLPAFSGMAVLGMSSSNPDLVYSLLADSTISIGRLYKSTDFGISWTMINNGSEGDVQGWYSRFLAVHPTDANQIVRGAQGLSKSTNGGTTFSGFGSGWADYHNYAYHPTNPEILYMVDDGGVWRSTDFGDNYTYVGDGLQTSQFYNGFSSSANDSLIALGQVQDHFGWMYVGSKVWPQGGVDEVGWTAINQTNDHVMYAGDRDGGSIYKSVDRGNSFNWSASGINGGITSWHTPFILSDSNPNYLYFGRSIIYKSTNAAGSWIATNGGNELDGNPAICMAMSHTGTDTVYVGTAPRTNRTHLFRTTDGGTSWTDVTGPLPDRYPLDITVDPTSSGTVYVALGGFDTSHVFKTTDAGGSWTDITGLLPDVPATAVIVDPLHPEIVYAGTDIGVFVSTSGGGDWMSLNNGLPEAMIISDLSLSPTNRAVRAVTHSGGVYERAMFEPKVTAVHNTGGGTPAAFKLEQNFPNPFNPTTEIRYSVPSYGGLVTLRVYDLVGREVVTLVNETKPPGVYSVAWNANNVASGVYYYTLKLGRYEATRRMLLVR